MRYSSKYAYSGKVLNPSPFSGQGQSGQGMIEDDYSETSGYRPRPHGKKLGCRLNSYSEEELARMNGPVIVVQEGNKKAKKEETHEHDPA